MRVLVACEFSGTVREAFQARGHDAWSCDLLDTEIPGNHIKGDVLEILGDGWDLMVAHPPCTFLTVAANKWHRPEYKDKFPNREQDRQKAIEFFMALYNSPIEKVCIENPLGIMSTVFRKPDCIVQPWQFGHGERKAFCFWLRGLKPLIPTHLKGDMFAAEEPTERIERVFRMAPSPDRWKLRSKTYSGMADAMASQWG